LVIVANLNEKRALYKFFIIYFLSTALLIAGGAAFYYYQQKHIRLHNELFSMLQYAKTLKFSRFSYTEEAFDYERIISTEAREDFDNIKRVGNNFEVLVSTRRGINILVKKEANQYDAVIQKIFVQVLLVSTVLLLLFSLISYYLALISIRPMQKTIHILDAFIKDLVHDLNTPTTSILLNLKMLRTNSSDRDPQRFERIEEATKEIASLYKSLAILLDESKLTTTKQDICPIVKQSAETYAELYPDLTFHVECETLLTSVHTEAFTQIIGNIISNACKYNRPDGFVRITTNETTLIIEDGGIGMKTPEKVFDRYYTESLEGHGIGMHIVNRLATVMHIGVKIHSEEGVGTRCVLTLC
jgi:two-component system OmpR family sensor kinase